MKARSATKPFNDTIHFNDGSPGAYAGEEIETMEDLFLLALFEIYTNLVV